ncbi:MAG: dephospho-CoA kinase [Proteobacteria bacterium]|nr:dephospho-CoA kinase [Pseudomonadota bacterium]
MIVIGLTGSIGMGKSTVAQMFAEEGAPAFDSDDAVHALYARDGAAVVPVERAFPGVTKDGAIDRVALTARVVDNPEAIKRLEAIVHPLVHQAQITFLERHARAGVKTAVLDIPLLFESGGAERVNKVVVVSAPADVQKARVMARPGMTEDKYAYLLSRQMPDAEKRARADFVIDTSGDLDATRTQVRAVLDALGEQS